MKKVVVVGSAGQDGRLLGERLANDCRVTGIDVAQDMDVDVDVTNAAHVDALIARETPDEVYYLAAHHHSAEERPDDAAELRACVGVHVLGLVNVLDALRRHAPACRTFYAGSSHMFGQPALPQQNEATPFAPKNPYAITKVAGAHTCALYRERGMHVSVGILYNHESPLRGEQFVSQRIVRGARRAAKEPGYRLTLGSLAAVVDWGWAPDYVDAMIRIVAQPAPEDYVVATGEPHTVEEFAAAAFGALELDWRGHVVEDPAVVKGPQAVLVGDASKLREKTGWKPTIDFPRMVRLLVLGQ
jgi:GDPmannose 4,6-dehydratase